MAPLAAPQLQQEAEAGGLIRRAWRRGSGEWRVKSGE